VEICRQKNATTIPENLSSAYFTALARLPSLVAEAATREWDADFLCCALSAIAAAKGFGGVAEAALDLSPKVAEEFMQWFSSR